MSWSAPSEMSNLESKWWKGRLHPDCIDSKTSAWVILCATQSEDQLALLNLLVEFPEMRDHWFATFSELFQLIWANDNVNLYLQNVVCVCVYVCGWVYICKIESGKYAINTMGDALPLPNYRHRYYSISFTFPYGKHLTLTFNEKWSQM